MSFKVTIDEVELAIYKYFCLTKSGTDFLNQADIYRMASELTKYINEVKDE